MHYSRRRFIRNLTILSALIPFGKFRGGSLLIDQDDSKLDVNIFSKHLQFLDIKTAAAIAADCGFSGLDLTVRPKGHVLPENVLIDLPLAVKDIKSNGSTCKMITTNIERVTNPYDKDVIKTAGQLGIQFYRTNWFKYQKDKEMTESLDLYQNQIYELGEFNKMNNIIGCYQNHAGKDIGSSFWEIYKLLETVDPQYFGTQYDIRHAMVEGGYSWENGLALLRNRIKVIVIKDFKWSLVNGKWKAVNVPVGEGMVDFTKYFQLLKSFGLKPPVSLHLEYPIGGAEHGDDKITVDEKVVFDAMKKDLTTIQQLWTAA